MIKIYCYSKCSTCMKAIKFLNDNNINYKLIDIKTNNPNKDDLMLIKKLANVDIKKLFNTSGLLYKEYNMKDKINNLSEDELLDILASNGMIVKRPILIGDDFAFIGFNVDKWKEIIK